MEETIGVWAKRGDGLGWTWLGVCPNRRIIEIVGGEFYLNGTTPAAAFGKSYLLQSANAGLAQPTDES